MKLYIQVTLAVIISTCQAQVLQRPYYISRQGDKDRDYESLKELMKQYQIENPVDPDFQTLLVPRKPKLRTYVPEHFNKKRMKQSYLLQARAAFEEAEAKKDKYRFQQVDKDTLNQLPEDDRLVLETQLSESERHFLLSGLEKGQFDSVLNQDRFALPGFNLMAAAVQKIGAGAGKYIGGKLAGKLGERLGEAVGEYLGIAAANHLTGNKEEVQIKPTTAPKNYGAPYGGGYGAQLVKSN